MDLRDRLGGFVRMVTSTVGESRSSRTHPGGDANEAVPYDPDEIERRADTLHEAGVEPPEFVRRLVEKEGGWVKQQAFTDYTDWSEATISRVLSDLEDDGLITRVEMGREKIVCLPEERPRLESST